MEPKYHGNDKASAIKRAKKERGIVVYSKAPDPVGEDVVAVFDAVSWGYWSDSADAFIRSWERVEANFADGAA